MEDNNRSVAGVALDVVEHLLGFHLLAIVAGDQVVHDDCEARPEHLALRPSQQSVRWTEQRTVDEFVGMEDVEQISSGGDLSALQVIHGVVAHAVSSPLDFGKEFGIACHIVAHAEEGGLDAILVKDIKHPRRDLRDGSVVKGEIDRVPALVYAPDGLGE